jgi:ATP-dependent Clp protease ATP-binding subunit ClpC
MLLANAEAKQLNHEYIGTEHVLLALVKDGSGVGANVLKNLHVDLLAVEHKIEMFTKIGANQISTEKLPTTPRVKKVIEYAIEEAKHIGHDYVGSEHILLGLFREPNAVAGQILMNLGLRLEQMRNEVRKLHRKA